jgi:hypothetical protein
MSSLRVGGWSLIGASILFWLYWFLMPEPGTVDASFILSAIAKQRGSVLLSAILQTLCAIAIVPAALSVGVVRSRLVYAGALVMLVGALGNAADAVYHQIAYEMTAPDADRAAMLPVMTRMQTEQIWLLVPLLLVFFPGALCPAVGLAQAGIVSRRAWQLHVAAWVLGLINVVAALTTGISPRPISLTALALISVALGWTGWGMVRQDQHSAYTYRQT